MKRTLVSRLPKAQETIQLSSEEAHHLIKVLRLKSGSIIEAIDTQGQKTLCQIEIESPQKALLRLVDQKKQPALSLPSQKLVPFVSIELAILKAQALEWAIEKMVELGANQWVPLWTEHGVIRPPFQEKWSIRWKKIANQALKQSGRSSVLNILPPQTIQELSVPPHSLRFVFIEPMPTETYPELLTALDSIAQPIEKISLTLGPEGGWSKNELKMLLSIPQTLGVRLGEDTLRAETAVLSGLSVVRSHFRSRHAKIAQDD